MLGELNSLSALSILEYIEEFSKNHDGGWNLFGSVSEYFKAVLCLYINLTTWFQFLACVQ